MPVCNQRGKKAVIVLEVLILKTIVIFPSTKTKKNSCTDKDKNITGILFVGIVKRTKY